MKCSACGHDLTLMCVNDNSMLYHCPECSRDWEVYVINGERFMRIKFWG